MGDFASIEDYGFNLQTVFGSGNQNSGVGSGANHAFLTGGIHIISQIHQILLAQLDLQMGHDGYDFIALTLAKLQTGNSILQAGCQVTAFHYKLDQRIVGGVTGVLIDRIYRINRIG